MFTKVNLLLLLLILLTSLVGCSSPTTAPTLIAPTLVAPVAPTVDLQPTLIAVQTQAVQTAIANLTRSAPSAVPATATSAATNIPAATAIATLAVTNTPLPPAATVTPTYIPWTLTPTVAPYSCSITSTAPKATDTFAVNSNFDAQWVVTNTGLNKWLKQETDARYSSGTKMQKLGDIRDLSTDVATGESYTVMLDMVTPADVGTYSVTWVIITGKITICQLNLTVIVK